MNLIAWVISSLILFTPVAPAAERSQVFVLALANADSFDRSLPRLRYTSQDVTRFRNVLRRMTQVPEDHITVLQEGSRSAVKAAFATLQEQLRSAGQPLDTKFIFYYTGHSDTKGLHLADGLLGKDELNGMLASLPAHARVAFFDSCYAGALAAKGIKPAADFLVPRAEYDEPSGSVFLAATSGSDVAFELEELGGSLFTHHVVAGLYGAADNNHDGLVTVDELYQYVYQQMNTASPTLPRGQQQTPEYAMRLSGKGALVLAEVQRSTRPVAIDADISGRLTLSTDGGLQVFHLLKEEGTVLPLQLVPGDYRVLLEQDDNIGRGLLRVTVSPLLAAVHFHREQLQFEKAPKLALVAKGERSRPRLGVGLGVANNTLGRYGPRLEGEMATRGTTIEGLDWRAWGQAGLQQNALHYHQQRGTVRIVSALIGIRAALWPAWLMDGQDLRLLVAGGADYASQQWESEEGVVQRRFRPLIPKVAYGIGTSFTQISGHSYGISFRREFPFATDAASGDVLALGASIFTLSLEW